MKKFLLILLLLTLCLCCVAALADVAVTVYGANGSERYSPGILCDAGASVHCYSGPSTSNELLGIWYADGNTTFRVLTLTYDFRNEPWVLTEIREGSISRVCGYVKASELNIPDENALVREASLYDLMDMQCVSTGDGITCRIGPGKEYPNSSMQGRFQQGTILLNANGFALVEAWDGSASPSRIWIRMSDLIY